MKAIEVIERFRPTHIFDPLGNHILNNCDGCQFDRAITELIREAIVREREACITIAQTWLSVNLRKPMECK